MQIIKPPHKHHISHSQHHQRHNQINPMPSHKRKPATSLQHRTKINKPERHRQLQQRIERRHLHMPDLQLIRHQLINIGVDVPSSADFDVSRDTLRDALPRRISVLEHIDYQCITKISSADPTARKYGTPESPSTRNCGEEAYQGRRAHVLKNTQYQ
mgnify:CR=1 FL=1